MKQKYKQNETDSILLNSLKADLENPRVQVPNKLEPALQHIDPELLREIHSDRDVAIEYIILFASYISTAQAFEGGGEDQKGTSLSSKLLTRLLYPAFYSNVVGACLKGTPLKGPIVQRTGYSVGKHSYLYSFTPTYEKGHLVQYPFRTEIVKEVYRRNLGKRIDRYKTNPIIKNLLDVYPLLEIPDLKTLRQDGIAKSKDPNFRTKSGKKLVHLNRNSKSRLKHRADFRSMAFLEDHVRLFKSLTEPHLLPPSVQSQNAGGRVIDFVTLMPSWMREHLRINGEPLAECDFKALHPNIIMSLYGGRTRYLEHETMAREMERVLDLPEAQKVKNMAQFKKQHLAFFNMEPLEMLLWYPNLWHYYQAQEPEMMRALVAEKQQSGYKTTSRRMFTKEVEIMSEAIRRLNDLGIYVLYVYDALLCQQSHQDTVVSIMNEVALAHGVCTRVKAKNLTPKRLPRMATAESDPDAPNEEEMAKDESTRKSLFEEEFPLMAAA